MRRATYAAVTLCAIASVPASALAAPAAPAGLEVLRKAFAAAVAAKDRASVAKLSRFPLAAEVYGGAPKITQQQFLRDSRYFDGWFFSGDAQLVTCLRTQAFAYESGTKAFGAGDWYLDCNGNEYYFGARNGQWAFVGYQNINE